jgi:hypothetical protein
MINIPLQASLLVVKSTQIAVLVGRQLFPSTSGWSMTLPYQWLVELLTKLVFNLPGKIVSSSNQLVMELTIVQYSRKTT